MAAPMYFHKARRAHAANVYRLLGRDEDALTYALGHLMAIDDRFMIEVLKRIGVLDRIPGRQYKAYRRNYTIHLQELREVGPSGRRDIVIEAGGPNGLRVVVEAKIGRGQPDACQLLRYTVGCDSAEHKHPRESVEHIRETWGKRKQRFIVALTRDELHPDVRSEVSSKLDGSGSGIELRTAQWHEILEVALHRRSEIAGDSLQSIFLNEFASFFREHYEMNTYQAEVMVKKVDRLNAEIYLQAHMYVGSPKDIQLPLYFAPYFTIGAAQMVREVEEPGISCISRVVWVRQMQVGKLKDDPESAADHEIRANEHWGYWQRGLQRIARRAIDEHSRDERGWRDTHLCQLYFLSVPASLNRTVKGPAQIPPGFRTTVLELLTKERLGRGATS